MTTPFQGWFVIYKLGLNMINFTTKFEIFVHPLWRYETTTTTLSDV